MGQAKQRGSLEDRIHQARERDAAHYAQIEREEKARQEMRRQNGPMPEKTRAEMAIALAFIAAMGGMHWGKRVRLGKTARLKWR